MTYEQARANLLAACAELESASKRLGTCLKDLMAAVTADDAADAEAVLFQVIATMTQVVAQIPKPGRHVRSS